jgi:dethiobiotin synthetase
MRPEQLVAVTGTGTEVGKTWVTARLLTLARSTGMTVAARKPVQSFDPLLGEATDAEELGRGSGEEPSAVCPAHRWYELAVAPPMAATVLGRSPILVDELLAEMHWPEGVQLGFVEGAGGLRSPLAEDGDTLALIDRMRPDRVVVVAHAGLGTIHAVRAVVDTLSRHGDWPVTVVLNRWEDNELHRWNRDWLAERDGLDVAVTVDELLERCRRP